MEKQSFSDQGMGTDLAIVETKGREGSKDQPTLPSSVLVSPKQQELAHGEVRSAGQAPARFYRPRVSRVMSGCLPFWVPSWRLLEGA